MIAYKASDVKLSWEHQDSPSDILPVACGFVKEGLELEQDDDDDEDDEVTYAPESMWKEHKADQRQENVKAVRKKRQADQYEYTPTKTRCPLLLVADYRFFQEMGGGNTKTTINYLVCNNVLMIIQFNITFNKNLTD